MRMPEPRARRLERFLTMADRTASSGTSALTALVPLACAATMRTADRRDGARKALTVPYSCPPISRAIVTRALHLLRVPLWRPSTELAVTRTFSSVALESRRAGISDALS
jgi:hypothetical protein